MYIVCFNVSMFQNRQSLLLLWYNKKLVYPPELSRIAGFCTNSDKIFLGEDPQTPFSGRIVWACIITRIEQIIKKVKHTHTRISPPPLNHFSGETRDRNFYGLCMPYLKGLLLIIFREWMLERTKKGPWKLLENIPQKSLKKVCHDLREPCVQ